MKGAGSSLEARHSCLRLLSCHEAPEHLSRSVFAIANITGEESWLRSRLWGNEWGASLGEGSCFCDGLLAASSVMLKKKMASGISDTKSLRVHFAVHLYQPSTVGHP